MLAQALLTGAVALMSTWAGTAWPGVAGLALLGAVAIAAAAPPAGRREAVRAWASASGWACTAFVLGTVLLGKAARGTLGTYLDSFYVVLAWMMVATILPASRGLADGRTRTLWRLLVMLWALLGGSIWVAVSYLGDYSGAFFIGLMTLLALLILCHFWFRLRAAGIVAVNTCILAILGLPVVDLTVRCAESLRTPLDARRQYYLYDAAKKDPVAFGRWWNYYGTQWRRAQQQFVMPDPDRVLFYRLRPKSHVQVAQCAFTINSRGFRGPKVRAEKGNAYRIVALGESSTFGVTLAPGQRPWPELLEQLIRARLSPSRPVEVINAGVPGYRLGQNLYRLTREILPLKPDMVISYHGINAFDALGDAVPLAPRANPRAYKKRPLQLLADAEYRLKLFRFQRGRPPQEVPHSAALADPLTTAYAQLYRQLIQITRTNGIRLVLAKFSMAVNDRTAPDIVEFHQMGYPNARWQTQANLVHSVIVQRLAEQHPEVSFVDTHPQLDGVHDKFIDLVHFAPLGDQQMAETFFHALRPILESDLRRP